MPAVTASLVLILGLNSPPALRPRPAVSRASCPVAVSIPFARPSVPASPLQVLYDGTCAVCLTNKALLTFFDRKRGRVSFVDINAFGEGGYRVGEGGGVISRDEAMRHIHVIGPGAAVSSGADAVLSAYEAVGLGWLVAVLRLPIISLLIRAVYAFVSKHRYTLSRLLPGFLTRRLFGAVNSLHQMDSAAQGFGCDDEEECELPYDD
mmetsp:Transcript_262/g.796  ORF Transcript_262/g.796 Transcript_262/m.796 type:complete len:207 (-) Transcript_262:226-846(-)